MSKSPLTLNYPMTYIDHSFSSPEANIHGDEFLLNKVERKEILPNILRFWESPSPFIVLGRSNKKETELHLDKCIRDNIPIHRRSSGGGTVLQGPGCLNYALILTIPNSINPLTTITETNHYIMNKHKEALLSQLPNIAVSGITDLVINNKKFSGNAQRRKRHSLLFHGTFLLDFDISLITKYLKHPPKEPRYREGRSHTQFLTSIPLKKDHIKTLLITAWNAKENTSIQLPELGLEID